MTEDFFSLGEMFWERKTITNTNSDLIWDFGAT